MNHREQTGRRLDEIGAEPLSDSGFENEPAETDSVEEDIEETEDSH